MAKPIFTGSGVALVTPFDRTGAVNYVKLRQLTDWHIDQQTDAIIVCGTTGEASTLTTQEKLKTIQTVIEQTAGRVPVIAGTGANDTALAVSLSQSAQKIGADALLLVTPYYNKATQSGLVKHFTKVADHVDIPCILYNVPSRTAVNIHTDTYEILANHPHITAIKEASGNLAAIQRIKQICSNKLDIYSGNDELYLPSLSVGAIGIISVIANILPRQSHDMYRLFTNGYIDACTKMQLEWIDLIDSLFSQVNPIPIKAAMNLMGMDVGSCRLPLCDMDLAPLHTLKTILKKHDLI
jgi:4-hydroxy-tetrahydrodipicolinate synthase